LLTGGQPLKFMWGGRPNYIVVKEAVQGAALLNSRTDAQRGKTVISIHPIDLVLGPGKNGRILQPEGLPGAEMDVQQKALFLALIEARLDIIMNADDRAAKMADVEKNLDRTYFAWWGPSKPLGAAYWRVTGPTVLLERRGEVGPAPGRACAGLCGPLRGIQGPRSGPALVNDLGEVLRPVIVEKSGGPGPPDVAAQVVKAG